MGPIGFPGSAGAAISREAVILANKDVLAVKSLETWTVGVAIRPASRKLSLDIVIIVTGLSTPGFLRWCASFAPWHNARVIDNNK